MDPPNDNIGHPDDKIGILEPNWPYQTHEDLTDHANKKKTLHSDSPNHLPSKIVLKKNLLKWEVQKIQIIFEGHDFSHIFDLYISFETIVVFF